MRITNFFSFLTNLDGDTGDTKAPTDDPSPPSAEFFSWSTGDSSLWGSPKTRRRFEDNHGG